MNDNLLYFDIQMGQIKPESMRNRQTRCPFCHPHELEGVIDTNGSIILVKNKYPVMRDTFPTVLIEHKSCDQHLAVYDKEHLYQLLHFGLEHWQRLKNSGEFRSVMFYKNHGPYSGGSIHHPHMQIVGLKHVDCQKNVRREHFEGVHVHGKVGGEVTISTDPIMGFFEFNVLLKGKDQVHLMADYIQKVTRYILTLFHRSCNSYNLFFYELDEEILVKLVPRFVVSPIFVGYKIPQVASNITEKAEELCKYIESERL